MAESVRCLDVRDDLRAGRQPMARILVFVTGMGEAQPWRLLATFEPIPLLRLMEKRGFAHKASRRPDGDWEVLFTPKGDEVSPTSETTAPLSGAVAPKDAPRRYLDNRGLVPPEPMMHVLEALNDLRKGEVLEVLNDRRPMFLYPDLEARGYATFTEDMEDGARILIWARES